MLDTSSKIYHRLTVLSDDVQSFFDPVVDEVLNHIGNHLDKDAKIKTVVIPGGFGKSEYLRERLQARFGGRGLHIDSAIQLSVGK